MGQEVIQSRHHRSAFVTELGRIEEGKLGRHVVGKGAGNKRGVGPWLTPNTGRADLGCRGLRDYRGADYHTLIGGPCHPDRRHGIGIPSRVGDDLDWCTLRVFSYIGGMVGDCRGDKGTAGIFMRHGDHVALMVHFAFVPFTLEIVAALRGILSMTNPVRNAVIVHKHVRPDHLGSFTPQTIHEVGVAFEVDILDDTEDPLLRIDRPQGPIPGNPELGEIVTDKIGCRPWPLWSCRSRKAQLRRRRSCDRPDQSGR